MNKNNPIKRIFELYTSDLSFSEIERLIKRDASEVYDYFSQDIPKSETSKSKFIRALIFMRSLFNAFILKLSAARRIFYLLSLVVFFVGLVQNSESYIIFSFLVLNILLAFELADKLTMKDEIALARKIQSGLMPKSPPIIKGFQIATHYESAKEIGGDYIDLISNEGSEKLFVIIGDISGKGLASALYMIRVQAIIHSLIKDSYKVKDIILKLKNAFSKNLRPGYFLTITAASIKPNGTLEICNAGHTPIIYYKHSEDSFENINPKGIGIGLNDNGVFEKTLDSIRMKPGIGDVLLFYTDGVTEAMNENRLEFGDDRLKNVIRRNAHKSSEEIKTSIIKEIKFFMGNAAQHDDITLIVVKVI